MGLGGKLNLKFKMERKIMMEGVWGREGASKLVKKAENLILMSV